jgi:hypothetical protein
LPTSRIATLSSGEFVGITADSPDQLMPLKAVHCQVQLEKQPVHKPISQPTKLISKEIVNNTFLPIQQEAKATVGNRLDHMRTNPDLNKLILNPKVGARRKQNKL